MALKDLDEIKPLENTGKKPKAKASTTKKKTQKPKEARGVVRLLRKWRRCADCGAKLRGGHVVEKSGKKGAKPKIYCLDCR